MSTTRRVQPRESASSSQASRVPLAWRSPEPAPWVLHPSPRPPSTLLISLPKARLRVRLQAFAFASDWASTQGTGAVACRRCRRKRSWSLDCRARQEALRGSTSLSASCPSAYSGALQHGKIREMTEHSLHRPEKIWLFGVPSFPGPGGMAWLDGSWRPISS